MSEPEPQGRGGTVWDAPNQQVVPDGQPPWVEGTGGQPGPGPQELAEQQAAEMTDEQRGEPAADEPAEEQPAKSLDEMTKAELLAHAEANGIEANDSMTKDEIKAAIHSG